ncbi:MAG: phosphotransferase, partial [Oscillospiraceae bacterium]
MKDMVFESAEKVKALLTANFSRMYKTTNNTVIEFMQLSENYTFFVIIGKTKRILRVYRPKYHSYDDLQSETFWMNRLKIDTQLTIPKVVSGLDGKMIQKFRSDECDITYYCCMVTYLDGTLAAKLELKGNELMKKMVSVGKISAALHNYVIKNEINVPRFQWDFDSMFGEKAVWGSWRKCSVLSPEDISSFEKVLGIIERRLKKFGKGFDRYGLIHSDLRFNNIIVKGNRL